MMQRFKRWFTPAVALICLMVLALMASISAWLTGNNSDAEKYAFAVISLALGYNLGLAEIRERIRQPAADLRRIITEARASQRDQT